MDTEECYGVFDTSWLFLGLPQFLSRPENLRVSLAVLGGRYSHSMADLTSLLSCSFQQRHLPSFLQWTQWWWLGRGEARYCLSATKLNRAMFILLANSDDALHGGRGTGRLGKSRAFALLLFTHPPLAPICSFVVSISGTRVGQCSAILSPDAGL